jgi:hypothetical protein
MQKIFHNPDQYGFILLIHRIMPFLFKDLICESCEEKYQR